MYECFDVSIAGKVAHLQLKRPDELNTMIPAFWSELPRIVEDLDARAAARAIVISSTGRHFSAGMDLSVFTGESPLASSGGVSETGRQRARLWMMVQHLQDSFTALERARMPVLAAIQGGCIGGAVDMVCAADMRYCSADAFFCIQEINVGMAADLGTLQRLPKLIPEGIVRELAYTGRRLPAYRALSTGLVNEVFDTQQAMLEAAMQTALEIAARPPVAVWATKQAIDYARDHSVADGLRQMGWLQAGMWDTAAVAEAIEARSERRAAEFADLQPLRFFSD